VGVIKYPIKRIKLAPLCKNNHSNERHLSAILLQEQPTAAVARILLRCSVRSAIRAAEHMGLTRSNVSRQIQTLEEDFGVTLFERRGPQMVLTAEGKKLLEHAMPILDNIQICRKCFKKTLKSR